MCIPYTEFLQKAAKGKQMRKAKENVATDKESALEIIELAAADFESLANAFNLIADVCSHQNEELESDDETSSEVFVH